MKTSVTEEQYLRYFKKLEEEFPTFVEVYFRSEWHDPQHKSTTPFYHHWTSIHRRNCYGLWYTNNLLENVYKQWTSLKKNSKCHRLDEALQFGITLFKNAAHQQSIKGIRKSSAKTTEHKVKKRFKEGKKLWESTKLLDESTWRVSVPSREKDDTRYEFTLSTCWCPCEDHMYSGKVCAHIFAAAIFTSTRLTEPIVVNQADPLQFLADLFLRIFPSSNMVLPDRTTPTTNQDYLATIKLGQGRPKDKAKGGKKKSKKNKIKFVSPDLEHLPAPEENTSTQEIPAVWQQENDSDSDFGGADTYDFLPSDQHDAVTTDAVVNNQEEQTTTETTITTLDTNELSITIPQITIVRSRKKRLLKRRNNFNKLDDNLTSPTTSPTKSPVVSPVKQNVSPLEPKKKKQKSENRRWQEIVEEAKNNAQQSFTQGRSARTRIQRDYSNTEDWK
jgi:hypothetical protein